MYDCNHKELKPYHQIAKLFDFDNKTTEKQSESKPEVRVVCLGKTGAGKTTFINCLFNYLSGRTYEDERMIAITQQIVLRDPVSSKQVKKQYICTFEEFKHKQNDDLLASAGQS